MSGVLVTTERAGRTAFSEPYLDETLGFLVADHRRAEFSDAAWIRAQGGLRIGVPDLPYLRELVDREFPSAAIVPMPLSSLESHLNGRTDEFDAVVLPAERASFLTLLHPAFSVAVPHPLDIRLPLGYPVARGEVEAARFLSLWIDLKRKDGTIKALYDHWILGRESRTKRSHWSILRDVLHWGP
jgi:ABC-type amino acid transport substrate-binding protein